MFSNFWDIHSQNQFGLDLCCHNIKSVGLWWRQRPRCTYAQISVLKRKTLFNQRESVGQNEFHVTESMIGCPLFFILVLKIGRNSLKNHPVLSIHMKGLYHKAFLSQAQIYEHKEPTFLTIRSPWFEFVMLPVSSRAFWNLKHRVKHRTFCLTMRCFERCFSFFNDAMF